MPIANFSLLDNTLTSLDFNLPPIVSTPTFDKSGNTIPYSNYQVPLSSVIYLDSVNGNDANNGLSASQPKKTIWGTSGAYAAVPSGGTIVARNGIYEEGFVGDTVTVPIRTKPCRIQAYPGEQPWFDGSVAVSGWVKSGTTWTKSGFTFNAGNSSGFATSDKPAQTFYFDQLFINGSPQKRVASAPVAGQFSFDPATGIITIGSDPTGKEVRVSRFRGFGVFSAKIDLLGIGIRRYACGATATNKDISASRGYEAVYYGGSSLGTKIEKCAFVDNAMVSLSVSKAEFVINENLFVRAGKSHAQIGGSTGCDGLRFTKNYCYIGNLGNFPAEPTSGGVKIVKMNSGFVTDNVFEDQQGSYLLWFDQTCTRSVIARNTCISTPGRKSKTGILWEISGGGLLPPTGTNRTQYWSYIVNNKMLGTYTYAGLTIMDSNWTKIWNNYVEAGDTSCYMIRQDNRPTGLMETAPGTYNYGAVDFLCHDLEFVNNDIGPANTYAQFIAYNSAGVHPPTADTMFSRLEGNWWKTPSSKPQVQWGTTSSDGRITITQAQLDARIGSKNYSGSTPPTNRVPIPGDIAALIVGDFL